MQWSEGVCSSQISVQFIHCMTTVNTLLLLEHLVTSPKRLSILQRPILRLESTITPTSSFPPNPHSWPRSHSLKSPFFLGQGNTSFAPAKDDNFPNARAEIDHFPRNFLQNRAFGPPILLLKLELPRWPGNTTRWGKFPEISAPSAPKSCLKLEIFKVAG